MSTTAQSRLKNRRGFLGAGATAWDATLPASQHAIPGKTKLI